MTNFNSAGFPLPESYAGPAGMTKAESLTINATLPPEAEDKLQTTLAYRIINNGWLRAALENARVPFQGFHHRIGEGYSMPWDQLKDQPGFKGSQTYNALTAELASITRDLATAEKAQALWAEDRLPNRASLAVLSDLAVECARFVNRLRNPTLAEPIKVTEKPEALLEQLAATDDVITGLEGAWPLLDDAWANVQRQLDQLARKPSVTIAERLQHHNNPRALPPEMVPHLAFPEMESVHRISAGNQYLQISTDVLGLLVTLQRDAIEAILRQQLENAYAQPGLTIMSASDRKAALKGAAASKLLVERKLCALFWAGKAPATVLNRDTSPAALLGLAA